MVGSSDGWEEMPVSSCLLNKSSGKRLFPANDLPRQKLLPYVVIVLGYVKTIFIYSLWLTFLYSIDLLSLFVDNSFFLLCFIVPLNIAKVGRAGGL